MGGEGTGGEKREGKGREGKGREGKGGRKGEGRERGGEGGRWPPPNADSWIRPCPDHAPFAGNFFTLGMILAAVDPLAKFKHRSLIHSRNIEGNLKFQKRPRDPDHTPFGTKFFTPGVGPRPRPFRGRNFVPLAGIAVVDPLPNLKSAASPIPEILKGV